MSDTWDSDGDAPEGPLVELLRLGVLGQWGLTLVDALELRQLMRKENQSPPLVDWEYELQQKLRQQLSPDAFDSVKSVAWAAYRQGMLHGELLVKHQKP